MNNTTTAAALFSMLIKICNYSEAHTFEHVSSLLLIQNSKVENKC